jgi:hypothetical protein
MQEFNEHVGTGSGVGKGEIMNMCVSQTLPIILLLLLKGLLIKRRLPSLLHCQSRQGHRPCQCCMRLNLSCLPDDLISVNRITVQEFGVLKLLCDAVL